MFFHLSKTSLLQIMEPWAAVCIPVLTMEGVKGKISGLLHKYQGSKRAIRRDRGEMDIGYLDHLFYIAKCKCILKNSECHCAPAIKIPKTVISYLKDQLSERSRMAVVEENEIPNESNDCCNENCENVSNTSAQDDKELDDNVTDEHSEDQDPDYEPPGNINFVRSLELPSCVNELNLEGVAIESIRYDVGIRGAAAIVSRAFEALGVITPENTALVIDPSKIQRDKIRVEKKITKKDIEQIKR